MKSQKNKVTVSRAIELAVAIAITGTSLYLHWQFFTHAGGLWRDEAHTIQLAGKPTITDIGQSLRYDSFPIVPSLIWRSWAMTGWGATDTGLRFFGLCIGLTALGLVWWLSRVFKHWPLPIALVLIGLNPEIIRSGDAIRPYGLGLIFVLLLLGLTWRLVERPSRGRYVAAAAVTIVTAQMLYQNYFFIVAIDVAAIITLINSRRRKDAVMVASLTLVSGLSLWPYMAIVKAAGAWSHNLLSSTPWPDIMAALQNGAGWPTPTLFWLWSALVLTALVTFLIEWFTSGRPRPAEKSLFLAMVIIFCIFNQVLFSLLVVHPGFGRYTIFMYSLIAVPIGTLLAGHPRLRIGQSAMALMMALLIIGPVVGLCRWRQTNIDLIASYLQRQARPNDLIVAYLPDYGVVLHRYFRGDTPWVTTPPVNDYSIIRPDLRNRRFDILELNPILDAIQKKLATGQVVWLIGTYPQNYGLAVWQAPVQAELDAHAGNHFEVKDIPIGNIEDVEAPRLWAYSGWKSL